jgi:hypothetical protein
MVYRMITKSEGYKASFRFFKVIGKLKLVEQKRINLDLWRLIRNSLKRNSEWIDLLHGK